MVADTHNIRMTPLTDAIPEDPFFSDDYSQDNNLQTGAEKVASTASFAAPPLASTLSPKHVWKKISDGISNNQGKLIVATTLIALAVLTYFFGVLGALAIGAICLIFISRR